MHGANEGDTTNILSHMRERVKEIVNTRTCRCMSGEKRNEERTEMKTTKRNCMDNGVYKGIYVRVRFLDGVCFIVCDEFSSRRVNVERASEREQSRSHISVRVYISLLDVFAYACNYESMYTQQNYTFFFKMGSSERLFLLFLFNSLVHIYFLFVIFPHCFRIVCDFSLANAMRSRLNEVRMR